MTDKKEVPPGGVFENSFTDAVKDSAQQIWLAGLGAFAKAQEEGSKAFETLYYSAHLHIGVLVAPPFVARALGE